MEELDQAWEDYQHEYIKLKNEMVAKLRCIQNAKVSPDVKQEWINQVINFIESW